MGHIHTHTYLQDFGRHSSLLGNHPLPTEQKKINSKTGPWLLYFHDLTVQCTSIYNIKYFFHNL